MDSNCSVNYDDFYHYSLEPNGSMILIPGVNSAEPSPVYRRTKEESENNVNNNDDEHSSPGMIDLKALDLQNLYAAVESLKQAVANFRVCVGCFQRHLNDVPDETPANLGLGSPEYNFDPEEEMPPSPVYYPDDINSNKDWQDGCIKLSF